MPTSSAPKPSHRALPQRPTPSLPSSPSLSSRRRPSHRHRAAWPWLSSLLPPSGQPSPTRGSRRSSLLPALCPRPQVHGGNQGSGAVPRQRRGSQAAADPATSFNARDSNAGRSFISGTAAVVASPSFRSAIKARGLKKHLKRLNAPRNWMLDKLGAALLPSHLLVLTSPGRACL